jgi:sporulation protein YlmC with PRC-barrel domain
MEDDMLAKRLALALAGTALMAAPALAQQQPQPQPQTQPQTQAQPQASPPAAGQPSAMQGNFMTQMQPDQWSVSRLDGLDVYNNNNEKIGDISELIVDKSGKIQAVVVGVGGFLGLGERDVAIPFDQVRFVDEPRATASTATTGAGGTTTGTTGTTTGTAPTTTGSTAQQGTGGAAGQARQTPDHALVNMTREQLRAAPEFRTNR